jgi:hypothetical protein
MNVKRRHTVRLLKTAALAPIMPAGVNQARVAPRPQGHLVVFPQEDCK